MNLDWNFYFDDWLIDKIPEGMEIKIEEHPSGVTINPPELTCYFGANPIYMYGTGKLYHEVLMSPSGIAIYPEFLERPGFEFVEEIGFKVDFKDNKDYWGNIVEDKHVGYVNALSYMNAIIKTIYGVDTGDYIGKRTPSSELRPLSTEDRVLLQQSFTNYQVFPSETYMRDTGCFFYIRGGVEREAEGPYELMSGTYLTATAPGAFINTPGTFNSVLFLKYTYIEIPQTIIDNLSSSFFHLLFGTTEGFRSGTVFDFGSTNSATPPNYGFSLSLEPSGVTIVMNDGNFNTFHIAASIDFRFSHRFSILRSGDYLNVIMDGKILDTVDISNVGVILFNPAKKNYISARSLDSASNVEAGDLEEIAFFSSQIDTQYIDKYYDDIVPLTQQGGTEAILYENIPLSLSYDLTYTKPTNIFIPNFFGAKFDKFYLVDSSGMINIIGGTETSGSYLTGYEPIEHKSILIKTGFKFHSVTTENFEENIDFGVGDRIPVLTKLTSDVHIPLQIYMKFKIPDFHDRKITYNIRLVLKSLDKFLWYSYQKFKTGEFV